MTDPRRAIPGVDALLTSEAFTGLVERAGRARVVRELRRVQDGLRAALHAGPHADPTRPGSAPGFVDRATLRSRDLPGEDEIDDPAWYAARVARALERADRPSLRRVINATGVVLHTNLGRAPLAPAAIDAVVEASGYGSLEYDLEAGGRGSRYEHCVGLLRELTGAPDALVVNNNAAAVVLVLNTLADGRDVVISRGELVEIGGSFRVPEIMARSGARMREVGATNRTHPEDYEAALGHAGLVLKVHRSNFRVEGFTAEVEVPTLAELASAHGVPLVHDLGSGALLDMTRFGLPPEPTAGEALAAGADVVTMSGDKLLGGPQAGIIVGRADLIAAMRSNPLCRALRPDKLALAALEATLALYRDPERAVREVPALRMLAADAETLTRRARRLARSLADAGIAATVASSAGAVGGGAYPAVELPGPAVALPARLNPDRLARRLRAGDPPVIGLIRGDRLLLDPRTVRGDEEEALVAVVVAAVAGSAADPDAILDDASPAADPGGADGTARDG